MVRPLRGIDENSAPRVDLRYRGVAVYATDAPEDAVVLGKAFLSQVGNPDRSLLENAVDSLSFSYIFSWITMMNSNLFSDGHACTDARYRASTNSFHWQGRAREQVVGRLRVGKRVEHRRERSDWGLVCSRCHSFGVCRVLGL